MVKRSFLFLQGVCSPFFTRLADRLRASKHLVHRISFNGGDFAYWGFRPSFCFRDGVDGLRDYLDEKQRILGISDQILFGDRRPIHRCAVDLGKKNDVRTHVFEEGYFRPHWVTLERDGVNAHSLLPRDADWYREAAKRLPGRGNDASFSAPFWQRAAHDVLYHLASSVNPLVFPGYRRHSPHCAPVEYLGYIRRFSRVRFWKEDNQRTLHNLIQNAVPFFLLPLQLSSDAQIRDHSPFSDMASVIEYVMESFARNAPYDARLVIKSHPLDIGMDNYPRIIAQLQRRFALDGRVDFLESGDLEALLRHARGVVTVNSTVGSHAIGLGCPTIALSAPIYSLRGLTFQGHLEAFWHNATKPDTELFRCFRDVVIHTTQVNGGFYSPAGIALAAENSVEILDSDRSPLEILLDRSESRNL